MWKSFFLFFCISLITIANATAQENVDTQYIKQWNQLKQEKVNEKSFRATCDLMRQVAKTNLTKSYQIFTEYLPKVKTTGNVRWAHVLLMAWGRAKESLNYFADAEKLFLQARGNAAANPLYYRESLVGTILLYLEWGKQDSLKKYLDASETECLKADDKENLSFTYTFKAMSQLNNPDTINYYLTKAILLAKNLKDKNALFTAQYNYAVIYCQDNLAKEVNELESLLQLTNDPSLNHYPPKLYERTNFSFRNAKSSVYYNLMQVNLLLTDYDNAEKYADLFYNLVIAPNPESVQAPYYNAEMSIVKSYAGDFNDAENYLNKSFRQFNLPENKIPYISYFIAAGLLQEHKENDLKALQYFKTALEKGNTEGLYIIPPELYYAHELVLTRNLNKAKTILDSLESRLTKKKFSAAGYYYYQYDAGLLNAAHNYPAYARALQTFYDIKDSLTNLKKYRTIQEVETKYNVKEEQQKVTAMQKEEKVRAVNMKRDRIFYTSIIALAVISILLLLINIRHRQIRRRQDEVLQQNKIIQIEKQNRITQMKSSMEAEENERQRIADKLHDDVGAMLSLASINIASLLEKSNKNDQTDKKLSKVNDILSSVSTAVRGLSHELTPLMIEKFGIVVALKDMVNTINLSKKIKLETILIGFDNTAKFSPPFLKNIYRIIQELLHNVIAHANATHAILELIEHPDHISLMVEDNGGGMKQPFSDNGLGLNSIRSKIDYLHGSMEINSNEEGGTIIVIEFPA